MGNKQAITNLLIIYLFCSIWVSLFIRFSSSSSSFTNWFACNCVAMKIVFNILIKIVGHGKNENRKTKWFLSDIEKSVRVSQTDSFDAGMLSSTQWYTKVHFTTRPWYSTKIVSKQMNRQQIILWFWILRKVSGLRCHCLDTMTIDLALKRPKTKSCKK